MNIKSYKKIEYLHNIFISDQRIDEINLPPIVKKNIESQKYINIDAKYIFWQEHEIRKFLKEHFPLSVLEAFDCLTAFALKADLARYCILYVMGGLYSDLSNYFINPLMLPQSTVLAAFKDRFPMHGAFWMVQNTIIYSDPRIEELDAAIKLCVQNVKNKNYGNSSLEPTGPALFGRVITLKGRYSQYQLGSSVNIDTGNQKNRSHYVFNDGTLVAIRLQGSGGKPSEIGLKGTNVYGKLWDRRQLFSEDKMIYPYDSPHIHAKNPKKEDGILVNSQIKGHAIYGPYVPLFEGNYEVKIEFKELNFKSTVSIDICCHDGKKIIASRTNFCPNSDGVIRLKFSLKEYIPDIEIRIKANSKFEAKFTKMSIIQVSPDKNYRIKLDDGKQSDVNDYISTDILYIHCFNNKNTKLDNNRGLERAKTLYPNAFHENWTMEKIRSFLKSHFSDDILSTYDTLKEKYGEKFIATDFAKYCLLYIKGGICIDNNLHLIMPIKIPSNKSFLGFVDQSNKIDVSLSIDRGFLFSKPGLPEINTLISWLKNIATEKDEHSNSIQKKNYQGTLLGQALALHGRTQNYSSGQLVQISKGIEKSSYSYIGENGDIYAIRS